MVFGCRHFAAYLKGKEFVIRTDHKPLTAITSTQSNNFGRLQAELDEYLPFTIVYINGKDQIADMLSRPQQPKSISTHAQQAPFDPSREDILKAQKEDLVCKAVVCKLWYDATSSSIQLRRQANEILPHATTAQDKLLEYNYAERKVIVAPASMRQDILRSRHDNIMSGHHGSTKTKQQILQNWWWPTINKDVELYVKNCDICQRANIAHDKTPAPLGELKPIDQAFQRVHIDLLQLPTTTAGNKYALVMVDAFTKWVEATPLKTKHMDGVAEELIKLWIARFGPPRQLHSDNGSEFSNKVMKAVAARLGICHTFSSPQHPQSNGQVERVNRDIIGLLA